LRYPVSRFIRIGAGLTATTTVIDVDKITVITSGTGSVSFI
jgi:hypothetical protein